MGGTSVTVPAGTFVTQSKVALTANLADTASHVETRTADPRFGAALSLTGPNSLTTSWQLDDFGRVVRETRADGTRTVRYYCLLSSVGGYAIDTSSNSAGCATPSLVPTPVTNEAPSDAVRFEHSVNWAIGTDTAISGFVREYFDRAGRKVRTVSQAFDGASQPANSNGLIVQDTDYNALGTAVVTTQPYFLAILSSVANSTVKYGMTHTLFDALGRPTRVLVAEPANATDSTGGLTGGSVASWSFLGRNTIRAAETKFDYAGLVTTITDDKGRTRREEKNPDGKVVRVTDATGTSAATGAQVVHQHDAFGNLIKTKDALQNVVTATYDVRGRKVVLEDPDAGVVAYCYDALGQLKAQQTSNMRGSHTVGNCPGSAGTGTTAPVVSGWTTVAYDRVGRVTQKVTSEFTSTWTFDKYADGSTCTKGIGKLCQSVTSHGIDKRYVYDTTGRPINTRISISGGPTAASAVSYSSSTGRVDSQTFPTGVRVTHQYTNRGYLEQVKLGLSVTVNPLPATAGGTPAASTTLASGTVLWQATVVNAWGKAEQQSYSNGVVNRAIFDESNGRVIRLTAGTGTSTSVTNHRYTWDSVGLLTKRVDGNGDGSMIEVQDVFVYDAIGRLTQYTVSGNGSPVSRTVSIAYNALGMILSKSDVGTYSYGAQNTAGVKPHALQSVTGTYPSTFTYDLNGNLTAASNGTYRTIAYTSFNLPDESSGIAGPGGAPRYVWKYDEDQKRIKEVKTSGAGTRTTWMLHPDNRGGLGFEREEASGVQSNRHFLSAGGAAIGVLVTTGALPTLTATATAPPAITSITAVKLEYWHKDHLGSLIATTDHLANVTARMAYDPFGKRRYTNSTYDAFGNLVIDWTTTTNNGNDRGFTGHEHLDEVGLVHMNGRVFDPRLGKFLQPDPFIQDPLNLQNYDRYAYCYNSPLICTDPTGYFSLKKFLRMAVAIAVAWYVPQLAGEFLKTAVLVTEGSAVVTTYTLTAGAQFASAAIGGFASGAVASGSLKGALQGAFSAGLFAGVGQLVGDAGLASGGASVVDLGKFAEAIALHGVAGCVSSVAQGGKCGPGALSAAFSKATLPATAGLKEGLERALAHAIIGGTASELGGGKFANGAQSGAFSYLFNCLSHPGTCTKEDIPEIRRAAAACNGDMACIGALRQFAAEAGLPVPRVSMGQALMEFLGIGVGGGAMGAVATAGGAEALTIHGAERLAGAAATRGGVLTAEQAALVQQNGVMYLQQSGQGAAVYVLQNAAGRYDVAIYGGRGLITTIANMKPASLAKLAERYGWK